MQPITNFPDLKSLVNVSDCHILRVHFSYHYPINASELLGLLRVFGPTSTDSKEIVKVIDELVATPGFEMHQAILTQSVYSAWGKPRDLRMASYHGVCLGEPDPSTEIWDGEDFVGYESPDQPAPVPTGLDEF